MGERSGRAAMNGACAAMGTFVLISVFLRSACGQDPANPPGASPDGWTTVQMVQKLDCDKLETFVDRPELFFSKTIVFNGKGDARLDIEGGGVGIVRDGTKYFADMNGDGKEDLKVGVSSGKGETLKVTIPFGDEKKPYFVVLRELVKERLYWGQDFTFQEKDSTKSLDRSVICYKRACYEAGTAFGEPVAIVDDNTDGRYDGLGVDAFLSGRDRRMALVSKVVRIADKLYDMDVAASGSRLKFKEFTGETGTVTLVFKGDVRPKWFFVATTGLLSGVFLDVAAAGPVTVPAGEYEINAGELRQGTGPQAQRVLIGPGNAKPFVVKKGENTDLSLGAPFSMKFNVDVDERYVDVGSKITVFGAAGEEYSGFFPKVFLPKVEVKDASGQIAYNTRMKPPENRVEGGSWSDWNETIRSPQKLAWSVRSGVRGPFEVRLSADIPVLGKCETEWVK
jgi:hypothetical protein